MRLKTWSARTVLAVSALMMLSANVCHAGDMSKADMKNMTCPIAKPAAEHQWLKQYAGEWAADVETMMAPGKPPEKSKGTESAHMLGDFWLVSDIKGTMMKMPFNGLMTLGYDTGKKKFVSTWMDSMSEHLWTYEGAMDDAKKTLTLEAQGPCPMQPGKTFNFKDVTEFVDADHKVGHYFIQGEDGKWMEMMTVRSHRVK